MAEIRSGARIKARPRTQGGELIEEDRVNLESSDDDDSEEGIPYTSPSKSKIDPTVRSLDHRRTLSQQLDDQLLESGRFKRRRIGSPASPRGVSKPAVHPARATSRKESGSSSSEDTYVRAGLVNSLNAALKKGYESSQRGISQVNGATNAREDGYDQNEYNHGNTDGQEQQDDVVVDAPGDDGALSEHEVVDQPTTILEHNHIVQDDPEEAQIQDIWDVPVSPEKARSLKQLNQTSSSVELSLRGGRTKGIVPQRRSKSAQSSQSDATKAAGNLRSLSQGARASSSTSIQLEAETESREGILEDDEGDEAFENVDESSQSEGILLDIDPPVNESFARDVTNFQSQYPEGFEGSETYKGPAEDHDITTHIDSYILKKALQLMRHSAWGGLRTGWHQQSFDINSSETGPVRILVQLLAKLERLLEVAPKASQLVEQNKFLNEHSNLLGYYFSEIMSIVKCIRESREKQESNNTKLHGDIVSCAIPMLFHVLASAWELGGHDRKHTKFTIYTIELLMRPIGWIGLLYRPLLRRLLSRAAEDEPKARQVERGKQKELEEYRKDLCRITGEAIDALEREEDRREQERQIYEQNLIREKKLMAQRKQEEEALMVSIRERKQRSLMSIRSARMSLSESSRPVSRQTSSAYEAPSQEPTQAQMAQKQPSRPDSSDWSLEEKTFLFKKIQESYPDLVDLDDVRWELNRTLKETEVMAEEILGLMLEAVRPEQSVAERDAHIHEVMQAYRRTWGHER
ncbi:hypothetical protein F4805DRAFT_437147 [Annulohypoxylon moriforme]|nr:hypothetical protein F4805DRAFT_437147 [Annulohypoxylon moriforme]